MVSAVSPLKRFSQNFLIDHNIARKIVDSMQICSGDTVVEIGPGEGVLTEYLLRTPARSVTGIELDERLIGHLKTRFSDQNHFKLIHQDFLKTDISILVDQGQKIRIIGNLPYSVTSPILFHIMESQEKVHDITIMVQKEVGERLAANPCTKAYGIPSVLFQAVSDIQALFTVSPKSFRPVPQVDSIVLNIHFHESPKYPVQDWGLFITLVKTAFNQRRKMLRNTLKQWIPNPSGCPIDLSLRPEQLNVKTWIDLADHIKSDPI